MSAELAHQKADKHFCVAFHRKVRIRFYPLLWNLSHFYNINANMFVSSRIKH